MTRFIVMDRTAKMPASVKAPYRRVAVVETDLPEGEPAMISTHARGIVRIVETWERMHVGSTDRCAFRKALVEACAMAERLELERMTA